MDISLGSQLEKGCDPPAIGAGSRIARRAMRRAFNLDPF
jgi:hypothetical protein